MILDSEEFKGQVRYLSEVSRELLRNAKSKKFEALLVTEENARNLLVDSYQRLSARVTKLEQALRLMVNVFHPREGEPGPDQHVEVEACDNADRVLSDRWWR